MARNRYFQFKQFRIEQGECAKKVTTDACLFGALFAQSTNTQQSKCILDIGAGTGLLSLMAAQNTHADITAVELDTSAAEQSAFNFSSSVWPQQLTVINQSIQDFSSSSRVRFDSIVTNPPFFQQAYKGNDQRRNLARHTDSLSFEDLAKAIAHLLAKNGEAWILLPVDSSKYFQEAAKPTSLHLHKTISLRSSKTHAVHRHILVLKHGKVEPCETAQENVLSIYDNHPEYTKDVQQLMAPYYLAL